MSNQPDRPWEREQAAQDADAPNPWPLRLGIIGVVLVLFFVFYSCAGALTGGSDSSASECRSLASDRYGAGVQDNRFTEVTFTDGDFIKGRVGAYVGGEERILGYWECTTESGSPVITFYSDAA